MSLPDSDTESTVSSQTRPTTATTPKTHHQLFPFAYPPSKSTSCIRFTSRLLVQIQQLISSSRALPILEIYRPSSFSKSIPGCPNKLHGQDLYVVQSDSYQKSPATSLTSNNKNNADNPVVGVIYTNYNHPCSNTSAGATTSSSSTDTKSQQPSSSSSSLATTPSSINNAIHLPQFQITFLASRTARGGYIFQLLPTSSPSTSTSSTSTRLTLELAKKKPKRKPPPRSPDTDRSSASNSPDGDEDKNKNNGNKAPSDHKAPEEPASFLLGIRGSVDPTTTPESTPPRSRPWLAGVSHKGIKVLLGGEQQEQQRHRLLAEVGADSSAGAGTDVLYTIVLMLGVYAGRMEGWF
ncbi:uncharacterized protein BO97DRAFT_403232 [Aspergillus homomorphus CBS 101889]|uniref:Uncharacterized protein n=1 Tax=Aspergillus homomorphus (strain CBS 101889) TaxID=1450537 RepID=A0A395IA37_ASPHC|nr:hypothetical protein BO97DRAFT_403232 [Aspergillus homomorphus CBS 101889]RAL16073.1 hypothetical protein BO97DRAFT_403232 [Aspergillus homomorphus CBS 101889]